MWWHPLKWCFASRSGKDLENDVVFGSILGHFDIVSDGIYENLGRVNWSRIVLSFVTLTELWDAYGGISGSVPAFKSWIAVKAFWGTQSDVLLNAVRILLSLYPEQGSFFPFLNKLEQPWSVWVGLLAGHWSTNCKDRLVCGWSVNRSYAKNVLIYTSQVFLFTCSAAYKIPQLHIN